MTNKNYLLIIALGVFTLILSIILFKIIFDYKLNIDPAVEVAIEKQFHDFKHYKEGKKPFPEVVFYNPRGEKTMIRDFRGQYLLLNLWATWCPGCVKELPSLQKLQEYIIQKKWPLSLVALSLDRELSTEEIAQFLVDHQIGPFALYHDKDREVFRAYPLAGMPTTLLIDPEGNVLYEFMGEADWTDYFLMKFLQDEMQPFINVLKKEKSP